MCVYSDRGRKKGGRGKSMLAYIEQRLSEGKNNAVIMSVGGSTQVSLKVQIDAVDQVGMLCRVKGMMGGYGEPKCFPWGTIASVSFD